MSSTRRATAGGSSIGLGGMSRNIGTRRGTANTTAPHGGTWGPPSPLGKGCLPVGAFWGTFAGSVESTPVDLTCSPMAEGDPIRIFPHRGVDDDCGSLEVWFADGWKSLRFNWENLVARRLSPNTLHTRAGHRKSHCACAG